MCGLDVACDCVNDPVDRGGEAFGPDEAAPAAPFDCVTRQSDCGFEIETDHRDCPEEGGDAALAVRVNRLCDAIRLGVLLLRPLELPEDP